eukprot:2968611-Amphidinium_carterae.1
MTWFCCVLRGWNLDCLVARLAPDLPHWAFVFSASLFFAGIGFLVSTLVDTTWQKSRQREQMIHEAEESPTQALPRHSKSSINSYVLHPATAKADARQGPKINCRYSPNRKY